MEACFVKAVKEKVEEFNASRGRRKELAPVFVDDIPWPSMKYGIRWTPDEETPGIIEKMAKATVRTMLKLKTRPAKVAVGILQHRIAGTERYEYLFRFKIPN